MSIIAALSPKTEGGGTCTFASDLLLPRPPLGEPATRVLEDWENGEGTEP